MELARPDAATDAASGLTANGEWSRLTQVQRSRVPPCHGLLGNELNPRAALRAGHRDQTMHASIAAAEGDVAIAVWERLQVSAVRAVQSAGDVGRATLEVLRHAAILCRLAL